jgi:hypothetical protein
VLEGFAEHGVGGGVGVGGEAHLRRR